MIVCSYHKIHMGDILVICVIYSLYADIMQKCVVIAIYTSYIFLV